MPENTSVAAPVDNSPTLTSVVGEMFGDFSDAEPESDAGAPPDATPDTPSSEGTDASAPAGTPPAEADPAAVPDANAPHTPADTDPLEGSKPLDYTVNGQSRSFDGITVLKDGAGIIEPSAMEKVARVFGERDHLYEQNKTQFEKYANLERLTTWAAKDAEGKETTLTGHAAVKAQYSYMARAGAEADILRTALRDPATVASLILGLDDQNNVVLNTREIEGLMTRVENAAIKAERRAHAYIDSLAAPRPAAPAPEAPIESVAMPTVEATVSQLKITGLTTEDKQFLAAQLPRYVRATTPEEKQQGLGSRIVDQSFTALVQREAARLASSSKIASTATTAAAANAAKVAAASIGKKTGAVNAPRITPTKEPERTRDDDFSDAWDRQERAASGALRAHASGR